MDVEALSTTPIFLSSLVVCAIVATYAFAAFLRSIISGFSRIVASAGLHPSELKAIECAGLFHNQLETLIGRVLALEELAAEAPDTFNDTSWKRLLELCDDLEAVRTELHARLGERDFDTAAKLGILVSGAASAIPKIPRTPGAVELRKVSYWHRTSKELLQRMVVKLEDLAKIGTSGDLLQPTDRFTQTIAEMKEILSREDDLLDV